MGKVLSLSETIDLYTLYCMYLQFKYWYMLYTCKYMFYEYIRAAGCIPYIHVASTYTCIKNFKK